MSRVEKLTEEIKEHLNEEYDCVPDKEKTTQFTSLRKKEEWDKIFAFPELPNIRPDAIKIIVYEVIEKSQTRGETVAPRFDGEIVSVEEFDALAKMLMIKKK